MPNCLTQIKNFAVNLMAHEDLTVDSKISRLTQRSHGPYLYINENACSNRSFLLIKPGHIGFDFDGVLDVIDKQRKY